MNVSIIDPLQGDFPEVIEEFLEHGVMKCIAFNRRGTLLAAGCSDGSCIIWDFETRGIAKELKDSECKTPVTSVCWSKYGHHVLVAAIDKSLTLWNVVSGDKVTRITLQQTTLQARLHPGSHTPSVCLACPLSSAPLLVELNTGNTTVLPVSLSDLDNGAVSSRNKFSDGSAPLTPTSACFNKYGDLIYVGNSKGEILIIDYKKVELYGVVVNPGAAVIKSISFSRNGLYLLTNSNDRTIRVYENHLSQKDGVKALDELRTSFDDLQGVEKLKAVGSKCLVLSREFQDSINRIHWKAPCFSGDGEWVVGASGNKGEHKIYIWDRAGHLVKILEGPKEALTDLAWHPVNPIVVSVSISGLVYIWAKDYTENWSAFAPDFKELEENEEYVEREDEFDLTPETEKVKHSGVNEDEDVDILTVEKDSALSDSDMSQEELCFLPAVPSPDVLDLQDKYVGSSSKMIDSNHSGSPLSDEAGQDGHGVNLDSSPVDASGNLIADDTGATTASMKRKRKLSEKGLELQQAEKVRKPLKKPIKSFSGKILKNRNKSVDEYLSADDETD
ncbi:protein RBL-like [Papaver somniferum]|uniref:protein RBL-like n=1 Tax=Papaver somniferum TaxID=3469 RepID=UPI000E705BEB|nr:protein RBL-like [Papaver somniferum]